MSMIECNTCSLFKNEYFVPQEKFSVFQQELLAEPTGEGKQYNFKKFNIRYDCNWIPSSNLDPSLPVVLIPIRNLSNLLKFTLTNLKTYNVFSIANIAIVDDRSDEDIRAVALEFGCSYLRVENSKGFSFSMLGI